MLEAVVTIGYGLIFCITSSSEPSTCRCHCIVVVAEVRRPSDRHQADVESTYWQMCRGRRKFSPSGRSLIALHSDRRIGDRPCPSPPILEKENPRHPPAATRNLRSDRT